MLLTLQSHGPTCGDRLQAQAQVVSGVSGVYNVSGTRQSFSIIVRPIDSSNKKYEMLNIKKEIKFSNYF